MLLQVLPEGYDPTLQYTSCYSIADGSEALLARSFCMGVTQVEDNYQSFTDCPHRCTEILVNDVYYETDWPPLSNQLSFYEKEIKNKPYGYRFSVYEDIHQHAKQGNVSEAERLLKQTDLLKENFVKFTYMFRPNKLSMLADVKQITFNDLISDLGGVLNLYVGISLLVFVEFIDILVNGLYHCCVTRPKDNSVSITKVGEISQNK